MKTEDRRICPSCGTQFSVHWNSVQSACCAQFWMKKWSLCRVKDWFGFEHYQLVVGGDGRVGSRCDGVTFKAFDVDLRCPVH
jgi:hypothetical protein